MHVHGHAPFTGNRFWDQQFGPGTKEFYNKANAPHEIFRGVDTEREEGLKTPVKKPSKETQPPGLIEKIDPFFAHRDTSKDRDAVIAQRPHKLTKEEEDQAAIDAPNKAAGDAQIEQIEQARLKGLGRTISTWGVYNPRRLIQPVKPTRTELPHPATEREQFFQNSQTRNRMYRELQDKYIKEGASPPEDSRRASDESRKWEKDQNSKVLEKRDTNKVTSSDQKVIDLLTRLVDLTAGKKTVELRPLGLS